MPPSGPNNKKLPSFSHAGSGSRCCMIPGRITATPPPGKPGVSSTRGRESVRGTGHGRADGDGRVKITDVYVDVDVLTTGATMPMDAPMAMG